MALFPVSPTDGEYTIVNGITYVYASDTFSWTRVPGGGGGGGTPGGLNTQVQYNSAASFAGSAGFTFDSTSNAVSVSGNVTSLGNVSGTNIIQDGTRVIKWTTVANTAPSNAVAGDFWYDSYTSKKFQYTNDGSGNTWVDQSFPTVFTTLTTNQILNGGTSGTGNIGAAGGTFNTVFAKATSAEYADLAEKYISDFEYSPGTVVVFGGEKEITISNQRCDTRVAGVISTNPAFIMNSAADGLPVAFTGRVPCQVKGPVTKGDVLVTSDIPGTAQGLNSDWQPGCVLGKSLENINDNSVKTIEVVVGRF